MKHNRYHYKGWLIKVEFHYNNGKCDFQFYPPNGEPGYIAHYITLEQLKSDIDERIND